MCMQPEPLHLAQLWLADICTKTDRAKNNKKDGYHQQNVRQFLHILASPGYAPGTITVNVTWMKTGFNACQTHHIMYPSIFNCFPVIQSVSSKVRHFSTFWPPWVCCKEDSMLVKRRAAYTHLSSTVYEL